MTQTVYFRGTTEQAAALMRQLPALVAGRTPDTYGVVRGVQLRAGVALLAEIRRDFLTKSRGGTGRDGIKWPPLSPKTIAYSRRSTRAERKALGIGKGRRPSLSPEQDQRWRSLFTYYFRIGLGDMPRAAARRRAAAIAWAKLKEEGAKTKLELLGNRQVDILRDTGLLFNSLSPGVEDRPSEAEGQIFRTEPGKVIVGTNQKPWHHKGDPAKNLPARSLWPVDGSIPGPWRPSINRAVSAGLTKAIELLLTGKPA